MEFTVKLDRYEGPYTKLLDLIVDRKLSITEISLVTVADDYIAYIKTLDTKDHADISQFILVASTLMLMKAKSLLPNISYTEEEEKQVHDLEYKLELYQSLMKAQSLLRSVFDKKVLYTRDRAKYKGEQLFIPDTRVTKEMLQSIAFLTLSTFTIPKQLMRVAIDEALRLETVIEKLMDRVRNAATVTLTSLAGDAKSFEEKKRILVVSFIALLELIRSGNIAATQDDGGEIYITQAA